MARDDNILLPTLLKRSGRLVDQHIDRLLKQHAIARSQYRVLYHVARRHELTQKELMATLGVQGSTLTLIVDALVQKDWLTRTADPVDRRVKRLRLTAKGKELFRRIPDPARELHKKMLQKLSKTEVAQLAELLEKVIAIINT